MTECIAKQNEDEFSGLDEIANIEDKNDYSKYLEYTGVLAIGVIGGVVAAPFVWGLVPAGMAATAATAAVTAVAKEVADGNICLKCVGSSCGLSTECDDHY